MNTVPIAFLLLTLCVYTESGFFDDVGDFFSGIPKGVKDTFESMWKAVKKPFTRRMARGGRRRFRRRTTTTTTTTTTELPIDPSQVPRFRRVPLPLLPTPEWRGLDHWNLLQRPRYALSEGKDYEFRRRLMSQWAAQYIGSRPTRVTKPTNSPRTSIPPAKALDKPHRPHDEWKPVETITYANEDQVRPMDYYEPAKSNSKKYIWT